MCLFSFLPKMFQTRKDIVLQQVLDKQDKIQIKKQLFTLIYFILFIFNYFKLFISYREMFLKTRDVYLYRILEYWSGRNVF